MKPYGDSIEKQLSDSVDVLNSEFELKKKVRKFILPFFKGIKAEYSLFICGSCYCSIYPKLKKDEKTISDEQYKEYLKILTDLAIKFDAKDRLIQSADVDSPYSLNLYLPAIIDGISIDISIKNCYPNTCEIESYTETVTKFRIKPGSCEPVKKIIL